MFACIEGVSHLVCCCSLQASPGKASPGCCGYCWTASGLWQGWGQQWGDLATAAESCGRVRQKWTAVWLGRWLGSTLSLPAEPTWGWLGLQNNQVDFRLSSKLSRPQRGLSLYRDSLILATAKPERQKGGRQAFGKGKYHLLPAVSLPPPASLSCPFPSILLQKLSALLSHCESLQGHEPCL